MKVLKSFLIMSLALLFLFIANPLTAFEEEEPPIEIARLWPSWEVTPGVYSAYYGPSNNYLHVSPGQTKNYCDGADIAICEEAGIIKAGLTADIELGGYWDEGLFAFKPEMTINELAQGPLSFDVVNQFGCRPVWMTIEIDTGIHEYRGDNTTYQYVPVVEVDNCDTQYLWHNVDGIAGQWQQWKDNSGTPIGDMLTLKEISDLYSDQELYPEPPDVVRVYLRLGMGNAYHDNIFGTVAWVDKVTIGNTIYDFVVDPKATKVKNQKQEHGTP